jgi:hypothetical protein
VLFSTEWAERHAWVVWRRGDKLHAVPVAQAEGGRCPGNVDGSVVAATETHVHVRVTEELEGGMVYVCEGKDGPVECTDKPGEVSAGTACFGGAVTSRDVVIDLATAKVIAALDQPAKNPASVVLAAEGLKLSGQGCDRTLPLAK